MEIKLYTLERGCLIYMQNNHHYKLTTQKSDSCVKPCEIVKCNPDYLSKLYWHEAVNAANAPPGGLTIMCWLLESRSSGLGSPELCFLQQMKRSSTTPARPAGHSSRNICPTAFRNRIISSRTPPFCMFAMRNACTSLRSEEPRITEKMQKRVQKEINDDSNLSFCTWLHRDDILGGVAPGAAVQLGIRFDVTMRVHVTERLLIFIIFKLFQPENKEARVKAT